MVPCAQTVCHKPSAICVAFETVTKSTTIYSAKSLEIGGGGIESEWKTNTAKGSCCGIFSFALRAAGENPQKGDEKNENLRFHYFALLLLPSEAWAQARKPSSIEELAPYLGADREQLLYAGAKAEGKVVWYTSLAGGSYKEIVNVFEKKYPGVKVEAFRASGSDLTVKLEEETKAKRYIADAIETTEGNLMFMRDGKLLRPYNSPHLKVYPEDAKERARKISITGRSPESRISALCITRILSPRGSPRRTLKFY